MAANAWCVSCQTGSRVFSGPVLTVGEACQKLEVEAYISTLLAGKINQVFQKLSFFVFQVC